MWQPPASWSRRPDKDAGSADCWGSTCWTGPGTRAIRRCSSNAVVETNATALRLWHSLGFEIVGTVPQAFDHRAHGLVGLHVMHRFL